MLNALIAGLFVALTVSNAHERGEARVANNGGQQQAGQARLVQHASCYADSDCGSGQVCTDGECGDEPTICYNDDECRGKQICDMEQFICVDPTPSPVFVEPTTTTEVGCCYGEGVKDNEMCAARDSESQCVRSSSCEWRTGHDADCSYTPTTPSPEVGCCKGTTPKNAEMCSDKDGREMCERSNKCEFIVTDDDSDCEFTSTHIEVGCCRGSDYQSNLKCNKATERDQCERMGCEFVPDFFDCEWTTTSTTTTTEAPGCCYSDSFKASAKCNKATDEDRCKSQGCKWRETDDPDDCVLTTTTTTTTTEEPGCCMGDNVKNNPMCNARETREKCEKSSSCHFVSGGVLERDCVIVETTVNPGCCYINPDTEYSKKYQVMCTGFYTERECLGVAGKCVWEDLVEGYDCSLLWPTTTTTTEEPGCCRGYSFKAQAKCRDLADEIACERKDCEWVLTDDESDCDLTTTTTSTTTEEPGCCMGDSVKSNPMCNARETREKCEKSSSCHFVSGGDVDVDCVVEETTVESGCCFSNPYADFNKKWLDLCTGYYTERECLAMKDNDGMERCAWEPLGEYLDCEMLWPTTTTTTEEPGCCKGSSFRGQEKCLGLIDEVSCERKGCEWIVTDEPDDCILTTTTTTTTTTTEEPGCCKGDSAKTNERCNKMEGREKCERSSSCHFVSGGDVHVDCIVEETTTTEPGCCYGNPDSGYSKRWMEACTAFYTERDCLMMIDADGVKRCVWEALGEGYDCAQLWPTTTTTTEEPGCCRGFTFKGQAKCRALEDEIACERKECEWVTTDDESDCDLTTTTTTTTTTTEEPGCCKADSASHQPLCDMKETESKCDRSSTCHWMVGDDPSLCLHPQTTTFVPGCCYQNPYADYSKRWQESCTTFYTQRDCEMLQDEHGVDRCAWEELGDGYDCSQLWPTTTTTTIEPGCCYGDNAASNTMCAAFDEDADKCDARGQCEWRSGKDADCTFTPTTTTEEIGCCKGTTRKNAEMCFEKDGREQCERSGKCEFVATHDMTDCEWDTTTSEPWLNAKNEAHSAHAAKGKKHAKGANAQQSMLFGADSTMAEAMQYEVSLSTVLMLFVAALALHQAYKCVANRNGGYKEIDAVRTTAAYQTV